MVSSSISFHFVRQSLSLYQKLVSDATAAAHTVMPGFKWMLGIPTKALQLTQQALSQLCAQSLLQTFEVTCLPWASRYCSVTDHISLICSPTVHVSTSIIVDLRFYLCDQITEPWRTTTKREGLRTQAWLSIFNQTQNNKLCCSWFFVVAVVF